jgi:cytochrome c-type protein NapC
MLPAYVVVALVVGVVLVGLIYFNVPQMALRTGGRITLLIGLVALPLLISSVNLGFGFHQSSRTEFCLSCHEMRPYGMSLFANSRTALSAVHYQNRLIDRDTTCYSCHADYAMFGDVTAKMNGLRHVWVHYFGKIPEKIALYHPYASANCLHCHDDSRKFVETAAHAPMLDALYGGKTSCLGCHNVAHDLKAVEAHKLWQAK